MERATNHSSNIQIRNSNFEIRNKSEPQTPNASNGTLRLVETSVFFLIWSFEFVLDFDIRKNHSTEFRANLQKLIPILASPFRP